MPYRSVSNNNSTRDARACVFVFLVAKRNVTESLFLGVLGVRPLGDPRECWCRARQKEKVGKLRASLLLSCVAVFLDFVFSA